MRVSERMRYDQVQGRIESSKNQNANALDQLSSQKRINKISDDPIGTTKVLRYRDRISNMEQYRKNIDYAKGFMERSEAALQGINDNLIRAKELAVAMSNDTYGPTSREATAREIREIMDEIVSLGNMSFNGRFVFGGFRSRTPPLNGEGDFLGDDGVIHVPISQGNFRPVSLQARYLFEATPNEAQEGHFSMMKSLEVLYEGLGANDKHQMHRALDELDHQLEKSTSYQASLGSMWNAINSTSERLEKEQVLSRERLSKVEDADVFEATSEFKRTETVLQSTLLASTKLLQPSLLNFLQ